MLFDVPIDESQVFWVEPWKFPSELKSILNKTSPRTLANYIGWKMVEEYIQTIFIHYNITTPRWQRCVMVNIAL
jgi:hypothetical protein